MQIPHVLSVRQATILAIASVVVAVGLYLFGPLVAGGLMLLAFVAAAYAAVLKWAPEYVKPEKA